MKHMVMRPFQGAVRHQTGEIVDASEWRHTQLLIDQGHLRPAYDAKPIECACGRFWIDQDVMDKHGCEPKGDGAPSDTFITPSEAKDMGGGWYLLPDGQKVHGKKALQDALASVPA